MNDKLKNMVIQAGFKVFGENIVADNNSGLATDSVKRLIEIAMEDKQEACAKECEKISYKFFAHAKYPYDDCAKAIRMIKNACSKYNSYCDT